MQLLVFIIIFPILLIVSILPFRILYIFSDFVYLIVYYIVGYRKKTVRYNLKIAFPNLSNKERLDIEKKSYQHLCDMFLEMNKTMTISRSEMQKRFHFEDYEVLKELEVKDKSIVLLASHYASYEWSVSINKYLNLQGYAIYKRLTNKYLDRLVKKIRSRFKATLITTKETFTIIEQNHQENKIALYGFASDQSPKSSNAYHWKKFMGVNTPIHTGAELLAKKYDMSVVFLKVKKIKRGFYTANLELITEDVRSFKDYDLTDQYIDRVEKQILEAPEFYLWTHKRWKHQK